jgi:murein DD-endopeptidase MepM/ murein hydrolase activator NlpD
MTSFRWSARLGVAVGVTLIATAGCGCPAIGSPTTGSAANTAVAYVAPTISLRVLRGFSAPLNRYGAGHLGVDLSVPSDGSIRAAGAGIVSFSGPVAGRGVVVIAHPDGIKTEYEPVRSLVHIGQPVVEGQTIAQLSGAHAGCAGRCLHWGARRDGVYFNPLSLLSPLGPLRLLPID